MLGRRFGLFFIIFSFLFLPSSWAAPAQGVWQHGMAMYGAPKYKKGFDHFKYVNPHAPKGGAVVLSAVGTYDNLNPFILKGTAATGVGLLFDTLTVEAEDEASTRYGLIAEAVQVAPDNSAVTFKLRTEARFHDGTPITADDVIFSFNTLRTQGHPYYRAYYADVDRVTKTNDLVVTFHFANTTNRELPLIVGEMPIFSKAYYGHETFNKTTLNPPLGSGPYKISAMSPGKSITYKRVADYWAKDLNVNKGRFNFDTIRYDYYRDATVVLEAFKAGEFDFRQENVAKNWATQYNFPAVKKGHVIVEEIPHLRPTGMQGFVYNIRRAIFKDPKVREALAYAFDFGWTNVNLFNGAYTRTKSYFSNSELASRGLPTVGELQVLEPYRDQLPARVFNKSYEPPRTNGSGVIRENLKVARDLLAKAGWQLQDKRLVNPEGQQMEFEVLLVNPFFERITLPFAKSLARLGIKVNVRTVDPVQYQKRLESFDFDMAVVVWGQSPSPGNEQRGYWTSAKADIQGSQNYAGIKDPVVDALVEKLINAPDRETLINVTRALDRVLLNGFYVIPHWHIKSYRIAYWNKFGKPRVQPPFALGFPHNWWALSPSDLIFDQEYGAKVGTEKTSGGTTIPNWVIMGGILLLIGVVLLLARKPKKVAETPKKKATKSTGKKSKK